MHIYKANLKKKKNYLWSYNFNVFESCINYNATTVYLLYTGNIYMIMTGVTNGIEMLIDSTDMCSTLVLMELIFPNL